MSAERDNLEGNRRTRAEEEGGGNRRKPKETETNISRRGGRRKMQRTADGKGNPLHETPEKNKRNDERKEAKDRIDGWRLERDKDAEDEGNEGKRVRIRKLMLE